MEKHACKLCFRRFANGRALGGHMRSHVAAASPPSLSFSSSEDGSAEMGLGYGLRENPKKSFKLVDPEFDAGAGSSIVVQDRESETESRSPPRVIMVTDQRRRSKRPRRAEPEPASSVSDTTTEEDVALSLMMLSRDSWSRSDASDSSDGDEEDEPASAPVRSSPRSRFQCGTCKKVFRSYQALGGHRASHKKESKDSAKQSKASIPNSQIHEAESSDANADRIHECPVCFRVFSSGQALGGHKRSHLTNTITTSLLRQPPPPTPKLIDSFIDLNLPAPIDDDVELSAVSDPDFSRRPPT
ncbi:hypothetical protein J5N97_029836 [Dioscorea zingiberensis]|uniref:C2H2-type domain-containing protein n=1 Tax=Dioscorea zingiberensis TaxID=325984 RepID=A0A9D5BWF6_9LILI|nr:hypothetical protein J5N97_029836 [Dioscorea zingiberensis]